ncbi:MAG: hypothetical protein IMX01_00960 [Limnochordaceae bacterium]|nr:hypothetical protein [Limnochordaceae bacterium]
MFNGRAKGAAGRRLARLLGGAALLGAGLLQSLNGMALWVWAQHDPAPWLWLSRRVEQLDPSDPSVRVEALVRIVVGLLLLLPGGWLLRLGVRGPVPPDKGGSKPTPPSERPSPPEDAVSS